MYLLRIICSININLNQRHRFWIHQLSGLLGLRVESSGVTGDELTGSNQLADKKVLY